MLHQIDTLSQRNVCRESLNRNLGKNKRGRIIRPLKIFILHQKYIQIPSLAPRLFKIDSNCLLMTIKALHDRRPTYI